MTPPRPSPARATEILSGIQAACRKRRPTIVLPEGGDPRVREGALRAAKDGLAKIVLLDPDGLAARAMGECAARAGVAFRDPADPATLARFAAAFQDVRGPKCADRNEAVAEMRDPLAQAAMMVRLGEADGTVAGAVATTSATVRAALRIIGPAPGVSTVSSCFLMLLRTPFDHPVIFADCGLVMQPTSEQLAAIASASADTLTALTGERARIAMLSFSTHGSAPEGAHESIARIRRAVARVRAARPDLTVEGELQFDAALLPEVGRAKAPGSILEEAGNVFVFPSLSAGNIGYKIAQRLGGATAIGPILQGLAWPANDLSRGCSAEDVAAMIAVTGAQVAGREAATTSHPIPDASNQLEPSA